MFGVAWSKWMRRRCGYACQFQSKVFELGELVLRIMESEDLDRDGVCERLGVTHELIDHILKGR